MRYGRMSYVEAMSVPWDVLEGFNASVARYIEQEKPPDG